MSGHPWDSLVPLPPPPPRPRARHPEEDTDWRIPPPPPPALSQEDQMRKIQALLSGLPRQHMDTEMLGALNTLNNKLEEILTLWRKPWWLRLIGR